MNSQWKSFSSKLQKTNNTTNASSTNSQKQVADNASNETENHPARSPPKTQHDAVNIVENILEGKQTLFSLVSYARYSAHHKLRSKAYKSYSFLVFKNSIASAGWIVCSYVHTNCCPVEKAVRSFDVTKGGTTSLSRHTDLHEKFETSERLTVFHKLTTGERESITRGAVLAAVQDMLPLGFASKGSGLQSYVEAVFKAGQRTAAGVQVNPTELMPCRQTVRNHLKNMVVKSREELAADVIPSLITAGGGITCDGMKHSKTGKKYYDLVAHWSEYSSENIFTNECDVSIKSQVLLLVPLSGSESANNIQRVLDEALRTRYGVTITRLLSRQTFVTDCASTLPCVAGASSSSNKVPLSSKWMGCICHQLNTCMKIFFDQNWSREPFCTIQNNLMAAKIIVRIFKQSSIVLPSGLQLKQEVETRFSTTFLVVERFLLCAQEIRDTILSLPDASAPLLSAFQDLEYEVFPDNVATIPALNAIYIVCKPLAEMQKVMEASNKPTLHRLIPMLEHCMTVLSKISHGNVCLRTSPSGDEATRSVSCTGLYVRELAKVMLENLCHIEVHPLLCAGSILHPRLSLMTGVMDQARREKYMRAGKYEIRKMMEVYAKVSTQGSLQPSASVSLEGRGSEREERRISMTTRSELQFSLETVLDCPTRDAQTGDELSKYLKAPLPTNTVDLMAKDDLGSIRWWVKMRGTYPVLHKVALRVLATPASSCASERDFSSVNNTVTSRRSSLTTDSVEDLVFGKSLISNGFAFSCFKSRS